MCTIFIQVTGEGAGAPLAPRLTFRPERQLAPNLHVEERCRWELVTPVYATSESTASKSFWKTLLSRQLTSVARPLRPGPRDLRSCRAGGSWLYCMKCAVSRGFQGSPVTGSCSTCYDRWSYTINEGVVFPRSARVTPGGAANLTFSAREGTVACAADGSHLVRPSPRMPLGNVRGPAAPRISPDALSNPLQVIALPLLHVAHDWRIAAFRSGRARRGAAAILASPPPHACRTSLTSAGWSMLEM